MDEEDAKSSSESEEEGEVPLNGSDLESDGMSEVGFESPEDEEVSKATDGDEGGGLGQEGGIVEHSHKNTSLAGTAEGQEADAQESVHAAVSCDSDADATAVALMPADVVSSLTFFDDFRLTQHAGDDHYCFTADKYGTVGVTCSNSNQHFAELEHGTGTTSNAIWSWPSTCCAFETRSRRTEHLL